MRLSRCLPTWAAVSLGVLAGSAAVAEITLVSGEALRTQYRPEVVTSADFNEDGWADLVLSNPANNKVTILFGSMAGTFSQALGVTLTRRVARVSVGDLNCDGHADLAMVDRFGDAVVRVTGNGGGTFGEPESFAVSARPRDVAIGNFDGQGGNDLVSVSADTAQATILLNRGGGLGFERVADLAVGTSPTRVLAQDLNGDGLDDIVALNSSTAGLNNVAVLLNAGGQGFGLPTHYTVGPDAQDLAIADFNNDGAPDVIALSSSDGTSHTAFSVSVLLNRVDESSTRGSGVFEPQVSVPVAGCPDTLDGVLITCNAQALAAADYDRDGAIDFVVSFSTTPKLGGDPTSGLLAAYAGHGNGRFDFAMQLLVGWGSKGMVATDFTGDANPDIAVAEEAGDAIRIVASVPPTPRPPQACVVGVRCDSGFCVDGMCCGAAACPPGQFCNVPGREGTCAVAASAGPTPTVPAMAHCVGDCDCNASVTVDELVTGISIALGETQSRVCPAFDTNGDATVTVDELLGATNAALVGCQVAAQEPIS
jgi:hypothetical protein